MTQAGPPDADAGRPPHPLAYASRLPGGHTVHWPAVVVIVAVLIRLAFSTTRSSDMTALAALPDQLEYAMAGQALLDGRGLVINDWQAYAQDLYAFRMPGYPLFVAACGASLRIVRATQAILDGTTVLAAYLIGGRLAGRRVGLLAASAVAFDPYLIYFSSLILSETLFTAVLAWGVALLLLPKPGERVAGVVLLLLATYVRPSAIGLGVAAAVAAFAGRLGRGIVPGRAAVAGLAATAGLVAVLTPWAVRNKLVLGRAVWTTTNSGYTAYDSFNPRADGSSNQADFRAINPDLIDSAPTAVRARVADRLMTETPPRSPTPYADWQAARAVGEVGRSDRLSAMAWAYARAHPRRVIELAFAKLGRFWSPVPLSQDYGGRTPYVLAGGLYAVPLFVLAAVGVWRGGLGRRATLILLLPALYFSAVHCVFVGSLRYRVPCDVPLCVLAAAGAVSFSRPKAVIA